MKKDQTLIDETMRLAQDAWNYFPHRVLGGKSPYDLVQEYQQTGKIDKTLQIPQPKKGKDLSDVFEDQYPKTVQFAKLSKDTWGFEFPKLYHSLTEKLWELEESSANAKVFEKELRDMLKQMPELFDAANALAHLYGKKREPAIAKIIYEQTVAIALKHISDTFKPGRDRIIWAYMENRPFLRLLAGHAIFVEQYDSIEHAIPHYEELLAFNPNDNQGIRALLATAYLKTNKPEMVIGLASHYPSDTHMPELQMGKLLALLMLKKFDLAKKFIKRIKESQSHVIKELLKKSHPKPANLMKDRVRLGGADEAYYYWESQGKIWEDTKGAMSFLTTHTKDIQATIITITDKDVLSVDFFHDFILFLKHLDEQPIKRTAMGNISLSNIQDLLQQLKTIQPTLNDLAESGWKVRTEDELLTLHLIRIMSDIMRLTYKKHEKLHLSKNGRSFLENLTPVEQFSQLFDNYIHRLNWAYYSSFTQNQEALANQLQARQNHIWRLLAKRGTDWVDYKSFCLILRDELGLEQFLDEPYSTPEKVLDRRVDTTLFSRILVLFGCVELETKQIDKWNTIIIRFRSTNVGLSSYPEE